VKAAEPNLQNANFNWFANS